MGQIFYACAYDTETKECTVEYADQFDANCYSYSGAVLSMHYLLRHKPYRIMWGGDDVLIDDCLSYVTRTEDLLGISTYLDYDDFVRNNSDLKEKDYYFKVKLIEKNCNLWTTMNVAEDATSYFDWHHTHSVKNTGYLLNHTKRCAVDLAAYYRKSKYTEQGISTAIDVIPFLTETGGGTVMAIRRGVETNSTEELAGEWCGDLLEITETLPAGYKLIHCCLAEIQKRLHYCYRTFGVNKDDLVLCNNRGRLFEGAKIYYTDGRGTPCYFRAKREGKQIQYLSVFKTDRSG